MLWYRLTRLDGGTHELICEDQLNLEYDVVGSPVTPWVDKLDDELLAAAIDEATIALVAAEEPLSIDDFVHRTSVATHEHAKRVVRVLLNHGLVSTTPHYQYKPATKLREKYSQ